MKKIILLAFSVLLLTGCTNINSSNIDTIINDTISSKTKIYNTYRTGYKYYLPIGMYTEDKNDFNEIIKSGGRTYYMYVDTIDCLSKKNFEYHKEFTSYYSSLIEYKNKKGYIEVNKQNEKYLVEIMYNYAKIEVIVDEDDINKAVTDSIIVLSSIKYNKEILKNLKSENVLNYNEEMIDIFTSDKDNESGNLIEYVETDNEEKYVLPDYDIIK